MFVITGCVKTIAGEEDSLIDFSFHERNFGASSQEFLKSDKYTSLRVEVQYMKGFKPDRAALKNLKDFLEKHLNKPEGIFVITKEIKPTGKLVLNRQEVDSIRKVNRTVYSTINQIAVHILYTDGDYINNSILGEAYRNTSIVLFGKSIKDNSGRISKPSRTTLETTLLLHEFGHLLGLMDKGSPMYTDHKDASNHSHCQNKNCLMYYGIDIEDKFGPLIKREVPQLDDDCLFDLVANGGNN
jgi:predicted Zn-dependent protease